MKDIYKLMMFIAGLMCASVILLSNPVSVLADDGTLTDDGLETVRMEEALDVSMTTLDGVGLLVMQGEVLYINEAVIFSAANTANDDYDPEREIRTYYALSKDGGDTYSDYEPAEKATLTLAPDDNNEGRYTVIMRQIVPCSDYDAEYESEPITVQFDTIAPNIIQMSDISWDVWTNVVRNCDFRAEDEKSGISRITVGCEGDILFESHDGEQCDFCVTLDKEASSEEGKSFSISVADRAGNVYEQEYRYFLDQTIPTVGYTGVVPGDKLNRDVCLNLEAADTIMSTVKLKYSIIGYDGNQLFSICDKIVDCNAGLCCASELFAGDADYKVKASAYDEAGNETAPIDIEFRVDKSAPIISIAGFEQGHDYTDPVTAYLKVAENFCADCNASFTIVRRDLKSEELYSEKSYIPSSNDYTETVLLEKDGDYDIEIAARDAAGNETRKYGLLRVDKSAPIISIVGADNNAALAHAPILTASVDELFFDTAVVKGSMFIKNNNGVYEPMAIPATIMNDMHSEFRFEPKEEGEYLLRVAACDRAGNISDSSIEFTLDYTPPKIEWPGNINRKYLKNFIFPRSFLNYITDRTKVGYKAFINTYSINEGDEITNDGKYILKIVAKDAAGNTTEESARFIIDTIAPRIVVNGVDRDNSIDLGDKIMLSLFDEGDVFEYVKSQGADVELDKNKTTASISLQSSGKHTISLKAVDGAGNITEKDIVVSCKAFSIPIGEHAVVKSINQGRVADSTKMGEAFSKKKNLYLVIALFTVVCALGVTVFRAFRRIDTD